MLILLSILMAPVMVSWVADPLLGKSGYEMERVSQPDDYSGKVVSTVIRRLPGDGDKPEKAVLYVHGYNDYFFQDSMGREFNDSGYGFYAVDLRKYGRSLLPEQRRYEARDMSEYFADIDSAIARMRCDGVTDIVLMGHSTGGLITSLYMEDSPAPEIKALILNSPFLDWNFSGLTRKMIPVVASLGKWLPDIPIPQGDDTSYGESLLKSKHGEWEFDTTLKLIHPVPVTSGWVRAIDQGHKQLTKNGKAITVPIYLMRSRRSVHPDGWSPLANSGDAVLNVDSISARGRRLGRNVTEAIVDSGLHDLILSAPRIRRAVYLSIFNWLDRQPEFTRQQPGNGN